MSESTESQVEIREADWKFAARLLEKGTPRPEVESRLLDRGLSLEQVAVLLNEYAIQSIYARAEHLLAEGKPVAVVALELVVSGIKQEDAYRV
ncbi:hypothetical protein R5W24_004515, partial [Gemmata sp. JC717]|uniref:hypothetical protein n=1 Tax=Gemmata algarum TaxID=2975278 RepID=UPI0021BB0329